MRKLRDLVLSIAFLALSVYMTYGILAMTGDEIAADFIFFVAVVAISRYTEGYFYGIAAAIVSTVAINYFFMYPYFKFNLSISGYPITMVSLLISSIMVSALTSRMKDVTERNAKLYRQQNAIKLEADQERMRGNLLRAVSHDLRTPLTGIYGASELILENQDDITKEEMVQFAANIKTDTQWLINLVENLLSVTRITEDGGAKITKRDEIFEEIVAEAVQKVKKRFPGTKITMSISDEILIVPMDSLLIQQVVINLIENAIRHSDNHEEGYNVSVYGCHRNGKFMAVFEVRDFGKGIKFEDIDTLIDNVIMNTEVSSDATRGSGLGLSVCKSIIRAHGGLLEATNADDGMGGAIFRFGLEAREAFAYEQQTD